MGLTHKLLLITLLASALYCQSGSLSNNIYSVNGQSYQYIYGDGQASKAEVSKVQETYATTNIPAPKGPDPAEIDCPYNQVYDNILCKCVCIFGYYMSGDQCVPYSTPPVCGQNEVYKDGRCVCDLGYDLIGTRCDVCPPYSSYDIHSLSCKCIDGYTLLNGNCAKIYIPPPPLPPPAVLECSINEELINGVCVCVNGFYMIKG